MRKVTSRLIFGIAAAVFAATLTSASNNDNIITKEKGMIVVNTTELSRDVKGFKGTTPVKIYIKKNKVVKVETIPMSVWLVDSHVNSWFGSVACRVVIGVALAYSGCSWSNHCTRSML